MRLKVNEIFYSIQGEGIRSGFPSIFIRLTGCNLTCGFCDTEFESGREMSLEEILTEIKQFPCKDIVFTGGEPLLQLTEDMITAFKFEGYFICVETNGTVRPPKGLDHITLSPKIAEHTLEKNFAGITIEEIKYIRHKGQKALPETKVKANHYFISPQSDGDKINSENLKHCINLIKESGQWKLTMQSHKIWKVL